MSSVLLKVRYGFLSTPSARRATADGDRPVLAAHYFYPRPPRGGRRAGKFIASTDEPISIHALREEGDAAGVVSFRSISLFLSTPSARRATGVPERDLVRCYISIHALREEGD